MITYRLNENGNVALKLVDGVDTGEWVNTESNQAYLAWVALGNTPTPAEATV